MNLTKVLGLLLLFVVGAPWGPASLLAEEPSSDANGLMGRATHGKQGALRIVLPSPEYQELGKGETIKVEVFNEGESPFTFDRRDRWAALAQDGKWVGLETPLFNVGNKRVPPRPLKPREGTVLYLAVRGGSSGRPLAVRYQSSLWKLDLRAATPYRRPESRSTVPSRYPITPLGSGARETVTLFLQVDEEGRVVNASPQEPSADRMREAAVEAVRRWVFEPARVSGKAEAAPTLVTLHFGGAAAVRAVFASPIAEMVARLDEFLSSWSIEVRHLPTASRFAAVEGPKPRGRGFGSRIYLLRYGEEVGGASSWLTVAALSQGETPSRAAACGCTPITNEPEAAAAFLARFAVSLGSEPLSDVAFATEDDSLTPSGSPEAPTSGSWDTGAIVRALQRAFTRESVRVPAGNDEPPGILPEEAELLPCTGPATVTETIEPPRLIMKTPPEYPEGARLERREGRVILKIIVSETGDVIGAEVLKGDDPRFVQSALDSVCCWKYRPATHGGSAVSVYFTVRVDFSLRR